MKRAIRAARAAGIDVARVEVGPGGRIAVIAKSVSMDDTMSTNEWDDVLERTNGAPAETRKRLS